MGQRAQGDSHGGQPVGPPIRARPGPRGWTMAARGRDAPERGRTPKEMQPDVPRDEDHAVTNGRPDGSGECPKPNPSQAGGGAVTTPRPRRRRELKAIFNGDPENLPYFLMQVGAFMRMMDDE
uniref:Uncharacterized protein n=1 Tax=Sphaerodactylus townsendi TaxID=933632 RepID=A0ACB8F147_9SAUR